MTYCTTACKQPMRSSSLRVGPSLVSYNSVDMATASQLHVDAGEISRAVAITGLPRHSLRLASSRQKCVLTTATDVPSEGETVVRNGTRDVSGDNGDSLQLPHSKLARELCLTCLVASVILFICQVNPPTYYNTTITKFTYSIDSFLI